MNGMIAWFAKNPIAANLPMVFVIVSGVISILNINSEVFPELSLDMISIEVPYLGAAPEEVEQAVCVRIEEAIQGRRDMSRKTIGLLTTRISFGAPEPRDEGQATDSMLGNPSAVAVGRRS